MGDRSFFPISSLRDLMNPDTDKINCIKLIRAMTGEGLKESKEFFENEWKPFVNGMPMTPPMKERTQTFIHDTAEFHYLVEEVGKLRQEVNQLKSQSAKTMAAGIFGDDK